MLELKIAICDDEQIHLDRLSKMLNRILSETEFTGKYLITLNVQQFLNGQDLLDSMCDTCYDVFILDILMEPMNGLELAEKIQDFCLGKAQIIFLTTFPSFAIDGYKVGAVRYILKHNMEENLKEAWSHLLNKAENRTEDDIFLGNGQLLPVQPSYIFYMESDGHYVQVHFHDSNGVRRKARIHGPLTNIAKEIAI